MQMRYDEKNQIYRDCKWCGGNGCIYCKDEADKEYKRQFPDGPKPIATFKTDNPDDMKKFKKVFGIEALKHAFGPEGDGIEEIIRNLSLDKT